MDMNETVTMKLSLLYREFFQYAEETLLRECGLKWGPVPFILYIGKRPGCTHSELTKNLHVDWGYSHRTIIKLENGNWIRRDRDEGKGNRLYLLSEGEKAFRIAHEVFQSFDERILSRLEPGERPLFRAMLDRMGQEEQQDGQI